MRGAGTLSRQSTGEPMKRERAVIFERYQWSLVQHDVTCLHRSPEEIRNAFLVLCLGFVLLMTWTPVPGHAQSSLSSIIRRAKALEERGELSSAAALLTTSAKEYPHRFELDFELGVVALRREDWPVAISYFQISSEEKPDYTDSLYYLAQAFYLYSESQLAIETLDRALRFDPKNALILQKRGEYACNSDSICRDGLRYLLRARALDARLDEIDFDVGIAFYKNHQLEAAKQSLETALRHNPSHGEAHYYLAELYGQALNWTLAKEQFTLAVRANPGRGDYLLGLGRALIALDEYQAAVPVLGTALNSDPSLFRAHFYLASAYRHLGKLSESRKELKLFQAANERTDSDAPVVRIKNSLDEQRWKRIGSLVDSGDEAALSAEIANINQDVNHHDLRQCFQLGVVYVLFEKADRAVEALRCARSQDPNDPDVHAWMGRALLIADRIPAAQEELRTALVLQSGNSIALSSLGEISYRQSKWGEAIKYFEDSHTRQPDILLELCDAYWHAGQTENARLTSELIKIFAPDDRKSIDAAAIILQRNSTN